MTATGRHLPHLQYPVKAVEDVGVLRRAVAVLAARSPDLPAGDAELVATELATNILRHTAGGYVLCRPLDGGIELVAVDHGPGETADLPPVYRGGLGVGLAAVRRRSTTFDLYTTSRGTVVLARLLPARRAAADAGRWLWGGVNVPRGGSGDSGDAWAVATGPNLAALLVDGLGHGTEASAAAAAATEVFEQHANHLGGGSLIDFTRDAHRAMRGTRGGVLAVCSIAPERNQVTYAGVGNIAGRVLGGARREHLVSQHGTLGTHLAPPAARQSTYAWPPGATLVLTTDGVDTRWDPGSYPDLLRHHPVVVAATIHRDHTRGTDDAAILVVHDTGGTEGGAR